jgi:hypothetical protein
MARDSGSTSLAGSYAGLMLVAISVISRTILSIVRRFGTEGSEVRILSPRPKNFNEYGPRLTFMVGRGPFLLVIVAAFASRSRQL